MVGRRLTYSFVVARSRNNVIGCENRLPWQLPSDLRKFREITIGKPVIMGRRTFDSIGRPLPHRPNIVVSRENGLHDQGVTAVSDKSAAMCEAERAAKQLGVDEIMIVGGAEIFELFADDVSKVYLTEVDTFTRNGDAYYSRDFSDWCLRSEDFFRRTPGGDQYDFTMRVYEKPSARCVQGRPVDERKSALVPAE
jgi:dihydrofolate reductase